MTEKISIKLPWPPSILSPNSRACWQKKHRARKKYKSACAWMAVGSKKPVFLSGVKIPVHIIFHPPTKARRDEDNMIACLKAALDAVAAAWGVDDSQFTLTHEVGSVVKGGAVLVETVYG